MKAEPFWLKPKTTTLKDGTVVILRREEKKDLEPVWEMFSTMSDASLQYLPIPFTRERVEGWFNEINFKKVLPILGFVEEDGKKRIISSSTLAFSEMEYNKHVAIFGITVHDDYQDLGLGNVITEYMIEIAREKGLKKIALEVAAHNSKAISMYIRHGFKIEGRMEMSRWNYILKEYGGYYAMGLLI